MPGFDGTGPRGMGPMSGAGRGFCILKMTRSPDQPVTGFAGQSGWPVGGRPSGVQGELPYLMAHARRIEAALAAIRRRIDRLETSRRTRVPGA